MKKSVLFYLSALVALSGACQNAAKNTTQDDSVATTSSAVNKRECYMAIDGKDTAYLNLETATNGKIAGDLVIHYANKPKNDGNLKGEFRGDTLFADYTFTTGDKKQENRNPLAFLREGDKLTLGVGVIETYLGRSYLSKDKPIEFDRGRFKFNKKECE